MLFTTNITIFVLWYITVYKHNIDYQQCDEIINKLFWRHVSAVNGNPQANVKHTLGTITVCILWYPTLFKKYFKIYIIKIKSYINVHC